MRIVDHPSFELSSFNICVVLIVFGLDNLILIGMYVAAGLTVYVGEYQ